MIIIRWDEHLSFANLDALQGSLINTLREVRPTFFLDAPRVWEKIYEELQKVVKNNGSVERQLLHIGQNQKREQTTFAQTHNLQPPTCFGLTEKLVYYQIKKALGLDQAQYMLCGAAPLSLEIREYFLSLNMFLINAYGRSECSRVQNLSIMSEVFEQFDQSFLVSDGHSIEGTKLKVYQRDSEGNGEICYKGRHIFMGCLNNQVNHQSYLISELFNLSIDYCSYTITFIKSDSHLIAYLIQDLRVSKPLSSRIDQASLI